MTHEHFFKYMAKGIIDEPGDWDHPECPDCGTRMDFHGDDMHLPVGEEFWICPNCGFRFMYSDFEPYMD